MRYNVAERHTSDFLRKMKEMGYDGQIAWLLDQ